MLGNAPVKGVYPRLLGNTPVKGVYPRKGRGGMGISKCFFVFVSVIIEVTTLSRESE